MNSQTRKPVCSIFRPGSMCLITCTVYSAWQATGRQHDDKPAGCEICLPNFCSPLHLARLPLWITCLRSVGNAPGFLDEPRDSPKGNHQLDGVEGVYFNFHSPYRTDRKRSALQLSKPTKPALPGAHLDTNFSRGSDSKVTSLPKVAGTTAKQSVARSLFPLGPNPRSSSREVLE